ncbi:M56 family metallopeptidase [Pedobacter fastidiosus]|uniref:M48 family metalloprotease n=1 Tax=Pedobacter fastidiosus TaxID=2765361 RepID=A0ABR7KYB6_9SPHI|nr:M56 family metallopeptidase [Pedobacter fastidiosus]MBC6113119.1 M48 family metalloprotease [Pedobacter fastidiosus]
MEFKFINLLPENWLHALGATLFHSLWLGVLLALASGLVMFSTRKSTATLRYNLLTICLCLFVVSILVVFGLELQKPLQIAGQSVVNQITSVGGNAKITQPVIIDVQYNMSSSLNSLVALWNSYAYQIVLIWFFIICIKSIQLLVGLNSIHYLRNNKTYSAGAKWEAKIEILAQRLGIDQKIQIVQSGIAKMPMVVGHFKPLVLVPLGLLSGLSIEEVEAILAHELAHIKRRDYLVNVLQSFIEIVFFFNPAVLWVSNLIKTEREHCCDDLAINCVNDRRNYVQALISCQEFKQDSPVFAMAITGKKSNLLHRASRMLFNTKSTLNKMEKTILTIALVSVVVCTAAFKSVGNAKSSTEKENLKAYQIVQDTTKKKVKGKVAKASENKSGEQIEKEIEEKMNNTEKMLLEKEKAIAVEDKNRAQEDAKLAKEDAKMVIEDKKRAEADKKWAEEERKTNRNQNNNVQQNKNEADYITAQKRYEADAKRYAKSAEAYSKRAEQYAKKGQLYSTSVPPEPPTPPTTPVPSAPTSPTTPPSPPTHISTPPVPPLNREKSSSKTVTKTGTERVVSTISVTNGDGHDYTPEINKELLKDGIINNTNKLSYNLNKDYLVVNGVKQDAIIHQKYKSKYLKQDNRSLYYNFEVDSKN